MCLGDSCVRYSSLLVGSVGVAVCRSLIPERGIVPVPCSGTGSMPGLCQRADMFAGFPHAWAAFEGTQIDSGTEARLSPHRDVGPPTLW